MASTLECVICMEEIFEKNKVITECGHCFHTSCLMKNINHNGFDCPCCRSKMVEEHVNYDLELDIDEEEEEIENYTHIGFRWLFQRVEGEELEENDEYDTEEEDDSSYISSIEDDSSVPSVDLISSKLREQGVGFEECIRIMLLEHEEYGHMDDQNLLLSDQIFGKIRRIINRHLRDTVSA
jgi:hypothetical protein